MKEMFQEIATTCNVALRSVEQTIKLLSEGATVPFIARYRKEATGHLDEVQIAAIRDTHQLLLDLQKRKEAVLKSIDEQGLLTTDLKKKVEQCTSMTELEDLYLPYKPKRKTRASIAREKGLQPLADLLLTQNRMDVMTHADKFVNGKKGVESAEEALQGARDIIAEHINEDGRHRRLIRQKFEREAQMSTKVTKVGKEDEKAQKFKDYFEWNEPIQKAAPHRVLAMMRGEQEGYLKVNLAIDDDDAVQLLQQRTVKGVGEAPTQVAMATADAYKRLMAPSIESEIRQVLKEKADAVSIQVFAENIRQLLMESPLGRKRVLAIDPGFRTGCKVVCLSEQGELLYNETIYPHTGGAQQKEAAKKMYSRIEAYQIEAIAIGNGTAGRETEQFIRAMKLPKGIKLVMVNESGASVYSASSVAREEFPDYDITVRGAVSIGRRLMDPLAELVKIDPKSIGVGQYQHDVDQKKLQQSLTDVVESCVNKVGVEVNTASKQLLQYVSGLGPTLAENIVKYRAENGPFKSRAALKKVPRMGDKAFEQSAGFLRVQGAKNPLDTSAVHPESYYIVEQMAKDLNTSTTQLIQDAGLRKYILPEKYVTKAAGLPTIKDILEELEKPGRDPRATFENFAYDQSVNRLEDLREGMELPGIVTNITAFGCFVDVGVHQDGLVHLSQLADRFVKDPNEVVKLRQKVRVKVLEIDLQRKRVAFTMKGV